MPKRFLKQSEDNACIPAVITPGMHISGSAPVSPVYCILRSIIAAAAVAGSVLCFVTACRSADIYQFSLAKTVCACIFGCVFFSTAFAISEARPVLSRYLSCGGIIAVMLWGILRIKIISAGVMNAVNLFAAAVFKKYAEEDVFIIAGVISGRGETVSLSDCTDEAMTMAILLISAAVCFSAVKKPNILIFLCATFPLPEICLYFGLVPSYAAFALLAAAQCGALAAEIAEYGALFDGGGRIFVKVSAQSAAAAAALMLLAFSVAAAGALGSQRPESAAAMRTYIINFSWENFTDEIKNNLFADDNRTVTHDGRLGTAESIEFTGGNMLEVTLPSDCGTLYLKGFTGTEYTGSRWIEGPALPTLETRMTSPEFFSGRAIKYADGFEDLRAENVIVRNTGISPDMRYYPVNSAGLLETDGVRRRYGVYFPESPDWRREIAENAGTLRLTDAMARDEARLAIYAQSYCTDVPDSFTAAEDFFADYSGQTIYDELIYIRNTLASRCEYTLDAGKKPFGSDFAQWFLTKNRQGSCTHFASAAVLLCRSRGIPARYCEGFVIKPSDIADFPSVDGCTTVSVPDSRAHAWIEVYIDGFGWLSFEVTPGYGNVYAEYSEDLGEEVTSDIVSVTTLAPVYTETASAAVEPSGEEDDVTTVISSETAAPELIETTVTQIYTDSEDTQSAAEFPTAATVSAAPNEETSEEASPTDPAFYEPSQESVGDNKAAFILLLPLALAAALCLRRRAVTAARAARLKSRPERAAAQIYRMLIRLAKGADIGVSFDRLAQELSAVCGFDEASCRIIIETALKARFGGGITCAEARDSARAYAKAAESLYSKSLPKRAAAILIFISDRYI